MLAAVMADSSDSFQLVSIAEAVRILGVSDSTVRRLLRAGRLEAQRVERPQGHVWLVKVPAPTTDPPDTSSKQLGAADGQPPGPPALAAWMSSVLEPVMAELSLSRQQLVSQAETIGTLRAELAAERSKSPLDAHTEAQSVDPTTATRMARLRPLIPWVLTVVGIVAVVVLLAWLW
jgi:excisionase family DNA binding protein